MAMLVCFPASLCAANNQRTVRPLLVGNIDRPLRYSISGTDFVITNGGEFFNRPLYCKNSAFRIDGGDQPEFSLYLPGRGGNLRFGVRTAAGVKWLNDAQQIVMRYRPGSLDYTITDPLFGAGELNLTGLPLSEVKGFIVRVKINSAPPAVELVWAFGGANGMRGARGGDIGCERAPVGQFFQLQPDQCRSNKFTVATNAFLLEGATATLAGIASAGASHFIADANQWSDLAELVASAKATNPLPVVVGSIRLTATQPVYLALEQLGENPAAGRAEQLPELFAAAEEHRRMIAERVIVETPDPFINAAAAALNIAADAVWDEQQQSFMHGAVAWRQRLLGWRGPYAGDELGWPDRTAAHFAGFAKQQNTTPGPEKIPSADERFNLARNETALHSNGDMSRSHYDMNLVAVDVFFRHLLWTGDTNCAREMWPVIERHLAWERRLFRREFGADRLPLYEAYAAIWASDDLNYNGGGTTHASAYNYWHNQMAARVAKILGAEATSYEREADLILRAMRKHLWLADQGMFAEFKDYLGLQRVHPAAGLWSFYHTLDSEVPTPVEAWQMSRWVESNIAHIPVHGAGGLDEKLYTLPETGWMPYQWSLNNVVVAEAIHTALGFWQANRRDAAFPLFKGALCDTMCLGLCPGNVGAMTGFDSARGESQRDFADGIGVTARALVEGLFGVKPDALAGELKICPGFPAQWDQASIRHPDFNFQFRREQLRETFLVESKFPRPMAVRLQIPALRAGIAAVTVNGQPSKWSWVSGVIGLPRIEVVCPAGKNVQVVVRWEGEAPKLNLPPNLEIKPTRLLPDGPAVDWAKKLPVGTRTEPVALAPFFNDKVTQIFRNEYRAPRSPLCSLATPQQGIGGWCEPTAGFEVDDSGLRAAAAQSGGQIILPNGVPLRTPGDTAAKNIAFVSRWENYPPEITVAVNGRAAHAYLLLAGSTSAMQSRFDNGEVIVTYTDGSQTRLALHNPTTWWPIEQDYFIDDFAFRRPEALPLRVDLKTGRVRELKMEAFKGNGRTVPGGAATVLDLPLDKSKRLRSITLRALANEVVIGLMSVTLER